MINSKLQDKTVIVIDANHGISDTTVISVARRGAKVLINYFRTAAETHSDIDEE